jgi:hypothetical protein
MAFDPVFRSAHSDLVYELEAEGFREADDASWEGEVRTSAGMTPIRIVFHELYPNRPPKVFIRGERPATWHQELDRSMCLWSETEPGHFPWLQRGKLVERIVGWVEASEHGWDEIEPDLDLERYWDASPDFGMAVLPSVEPPDGWIRFARHDNLHVLEYKDSQVPPRNRPNNDHYRYAYVVDISTPRLPPRSWDEIRGLLDDPEAIEDAIQKRHGDGVIVKYKIGGHAGAFGLFRSNRNAKTLNFRHVPVAADSDDVRLLRSGVMAPQLATKSVAVVGIGAVGSFVADGLARAGVGCLTLIDRQRLRPGHLPRHAATSGVGLSKAEAVARLLAERGCKVSFVPSAIMNIAHARQTLRDVDLVVDASANEVVTELFRLAAKESGQKFICTFLANDGRSLVVDVLPHASGQSLLPNVLPVLARAMPESGCGDLVSPTGPWAVQEVAVMAVRESIAFLVDTPSGLNRQVREYPW